MSRILLLTASFGDGHNQAAFAVAEALEQAGDIVKVLDYVEWLHPAVQSFAKFSLLQGVQKVPGLYGLFYRSMSRLQPSSSLQRQLNHLGIAQMKRHLKSFDPDLVASTFPTPNGVMSELVATGFTRIPTAAIVTDYTAHRQWFHEYTDVYFVATESVKHELESYGVRPQAVEVTGIPVRARFHDTRVQALFKERNELRQRYGLRLDLPLILMMGGGAGLFGDVSAWENVIKSTGAQFAIICGRNARLLKRLQHFSSHRVRILGYTDRVDEWMAMAEIIVTKAGGITVTEAFAMELPMLLYRPIPGQEEQNAHYAVHTGAAELAYDVRTAASFIEAIVHDPERLRRMRECARRQQVRGGADKIATILHELALSKRPQPSSDNRRRQDGRPIPHFS